MSESRGNYWGRYGAYLTDDFLPMAKAVKAYVDAEIMPVRRQLEEEGGDELTAKILDGFVKMDYIRAFLNEEVGGLEQRNHVNGAILGEESSRGDIAIGSEINKSNSWVWLPAIHVNNRVIIEKYMREACGDKYFGGCLAMTEPSGGCNTESFQAEGRTIQTIARLDGDEWVINGAKRWAGGASVSQLYCTVCTTDPSKGRDCIKIIYVPAGTKGLTFGKPEDKMGNRATVNAEIYYDNVRVPRDYEAGGAECLDEICSEGRLMSSASVLAPARCCIDAVIDFHDSRTYGGMKVREQNLTSYLIGDMIALDEAARFLLLSTCAMFDRPDVFGNSWTVNNLGRAAAVKVFVADVANQVCQRAMDLMGSYGYMKDYHIEKYCRDVKMGQVWLAGTQVPRIEVAHRFYPIPPYSSVEPIIG